MTRACEYCGKALEQGKRRDARFCSQNCRQAAARMREHKFAVTDAASPKRIAYADPPYPGCSSYYRDEPEYKGEVDHKELIERLIQYDGWALSTSARALPYVLSIFEEVFQAAQADGKTIPRAQGDRFRVAAWTKGPVRVPHRWPLSSWEPVIYKPARFVVSREYSCDSLHHVHRPRKTGQRSLIGQKPYAFSFWLFSLLLAKKGDQFDDLYPGTGGVGRAWRELMRQ